MWGLSLENKEELYTIYKNSRDETAPIFDTLGKSRNEVFDEVNQRYVNKQLFTFSGLPIILGSIYGLINHKLFFPSWIPKKVNFAVVPNEFLTQPGIVFSLTISEI